MNKLKIYTKYLGTILMMSLVSLFFGIFSALVAGTITAWEDTKQYYTVHVKPEMKEMIAMMKEDLKNVD